MQAAHVAAMTVCTCSFDADDDRKQVFHCPLHSCANCELGTTSGHTLVRCTRCPVAYHPQCVPAGVSFFVSMVEGDLRWSRWLTEFLQGSRFLTCPRHLAQAKHPNSNVCLVCGDGGSLVCCDGCPAAYHTPCIADMLQFTGTVVNGRLGPPTRTDSPPRCQACQATSPRSGTATTAWEGQSPWWATSSGSR